MGFYKAEQASSNPDHTLRDVLETLNQGNNFLEIIQGLDYEAFLVSISTESMTVLATNVTCFERLSVTQLGKYVRAGSIVTRRAVQAPGGIALVERHT